MWRRLFGGARRSRDAEIERELRDHLDLEAEEIAARGGTDSPALEARRRFGNRTLVLESVRGVWRWSWLEQLGQDVRHGLRGLRRSPVYAIAATITLALGIGATTAVFSLTDPVLRRPFPLLPQERLVSIGQRSADCPACEDVSPAAFLALRVGAPSMAAVAATSSWRTALRGAEGSELVEGFLVSANLFSAVSAPFALGRGFATGEDEASAEPVTVLSYDFWQSRFGGSRGVLDSAITLSGKAQRVVGVLAKDVVFPTRADVYAPLVTRPSDAQNYGSRYLYVFGRLADGATIADARRDADRVSHSLAQASPKTEEGWRLVARPVAAFHTEDVALLVEIVAVAVALVLLAACVSVANLALARTAARGRELALRAALGGRRTRLVRHLLVEAFLVSLAGGALGAVLAVWGVSVMRDVVPPSLGAFVPGWAFVHVDGRALLFTLVVSVATTLVFALLPTLRATRVNLSSVLSDGGRASAGVSGTRLRACLVVTEVSVALVLLTGAALLARSVHNMMNGDPGVRLDHVLSMHLSVPRTVPDSAARDFMVRLDERLMAQPGIRGAGLTTTTPLSNTRWGTAFDVPGRTPLPGDRRLSATDQRVTPGYFRAMGIHVVAGRGIEARDDASAPRVVVISHHTAEHFWPGREAVGRTVLIDSLPWTIVGVVTDVRHGGFDEPLFDELYRSLPQAMSRTMDLEVWADGDPDAMRDVVRRTIGLANPAAAIGGVMTMRDLEARHVSAFKLMAGLVGVFAAITMVIAVVGLYGVIAYGVAQRTREIGVRIALGARGRDILSQVAGGAIRLTCMGILLGGAGAFAFAQLLRSILYGVTASDPRIPLAVAAALLGVAIAAALIPAWRAARVNPAVALRD
ncbi:MAG: permease [Gemmatimonadetes bacterium]|nr:permease [Gemmatimonadota bacterium]